jgi:hypothetical protein
LKEVDTMTERERVRRERQRQQSLQEQSEKRSRKIWGLRNIGLKIDRTEEQTAYLVKTGALGNAVTKVGGQWVGDEDRLEAVTTA